MCSGEDPLKPKINKLINFKIIIIKINYFKKATHVKNQPITMYGPYQDPDINKLYIGGGVGEREEK